WLQFRSWSLTESHRKLRAAAREINPNFLFAGNINGGAYGNQAYTNGDDMEMMGEVDDFLYSEIQYGLQSVPRVEGETKIANSGPLKFLAAAAMQKPVWMYCIQPSHPKPIAVEEALFNLIKLNIAEAYASHNTFSVVRETFGKPISHFVHDGAEQIYKFMEENEPNAVGARLAANVAIFCSLNQFYSDEYSYFNPASRVLADNGIAHVMSVERDFSQKELANYKVLVLPYTPLMSDSQVEVIDGYVKDGGGLVVMGMCSSRDENGLRRRDLGLKEVLGFGLKDDIPGQVTKRTHGKGRVAFIPLNPLLVGRGDTRRSPLANDHMMYGQGKFPAQVKGSFDALADAVQWAADGELSGKMTGPNTVELTTMEQADKKVILAHFVNYQVDLKGVVKPAKNIRANIMVPPGRKIARVTVGSPTASTKDIKYAEKSGKQNKHIEIRIPEFDVYSLATVYYE
ncbi:MAG: beta-galactosidase trimerization domain-containing protein, partial [Planctomycetota bacterium]